MLKSNLTSLPTQDNTNVDDEEWQCSRDRQIFRQGKHTCHPVARNLNPFSSDCTRTKTSATFKASAASLLLSLQQSGSNHVPIVLFGRRKAPEDLMSSLPRYDISTIISTAD